MPRPTKSAIKYSEYAKKRGIGRPAKIDENVLTKLDDAFMNSFTDEMACLYAGIEPRTLYRYIEANPEYGQRKEELKLHPNLKAQQTLVSDIGNVGGARYWAERRMKDFMPTQTVVHAGKVETEDTSVKNAIRDVATRFEEELKQTIAATHKKP